MAQITTKELSALEDLLGAEKLMVSKYRCAAAATCDKEIKNMFEQAAQRHCHHSEELYANLK